METTTLPIYNIEGKEVESLKLNTKVFDATINAASLYQVINAYQANQRSGLASTKTRGEVSGGGRKPWKQKGTGRARVGSTRSPLWRHGGVIFGPHPRDFSVRLPKKIKLLALKSSLNIKVKEDSFMILDNFKLNNYKAKDAVKIFSDLKLVSRKNKKNYNILLLLDKIDNNLKMALRNIGFLTTNLAKDTHAYEIIKAHKLIITKKGLEELSNRLK
jgi:large subunit ribosomal protein L4